MDLPKKSRKWRVRKGPIYAGHSSIYQKDYQNNGHEPVKTHRYTSTQQYRTHQHSSTQQHSTSVHRGTHTNTQHSSMQHLAMDAVTWPSVTPGEHSVSVQNRTNLSNRADNGESRVPAGPLPLILNRNLQFPTRINIFKKESSTVTTGIVQILSASQTPTRPTHP